MADSNPTETTAGGMLGRVVGKAKAMVGSVLGNDELKREGNLQDTAAEAEVVAEREAAEAQQRQQEAVVVEQRAEASAERDRLTAELEAEERAANIERSRLQAEARVDSDAAKKMAIVEANEQAEERLADAVDQSGVQARAQAAAEAARLEREALRAETVADVIDPEEK